jgi:hypothetical protein
MPPRTVIPNAPGPIARSGHAIIAWAIVLGLWLQAVAVPALVLQQAAWADNPALASPLLCNPADSGKAPARHRHAPDVNAAACILKHQGALWLLDNPTVPVLIRRDSVFMRLAPRFVRPVAPSRSARPYAARAPPFRC